MDRPDSLDGLQDALRSGSPFGTDTQLEDIQQIAEGGMSLIFRARQPNLDRFLVIKKLKEAYRHAPEMIRRFRREARSLAAVLHQNVAHVYDFIEDGKDYYLIMEYIDGIDLSQVLQKMGAIPSPLSASILLGVCKGLGAIHAHHLVHRDIKPSNIRISSRGEVKLMDFGIVMDTEASPLTRPGVMVGSPFYLSPEQVLGDSVSSRSDVFLLGICLYEMLTGARPFQNEADQTVFQKIRQGEYVPVSKLASSTPKELIQIVDKCLQRDPDKRYQSVKEIAFQLEQYLGPLRSAHTEDVILGFADKEALMAPVVPYSMLSDDSPTSFPRRRRPLWQVALVGIVVAALAFLAGYQARDMQPDTVTVTGYKPPQPLK